ncbi:MAG TPA: S53 family peptidase [Candidatus Bathyarchaeia archaeon]|nr:S53 family peptidase [Candidatus Bathyarchaeia archaeon]
MKLSAACFSVLALLIGSIAFGGGGTLARTSGDSGTTARGEAIPQPSVTDFQFIKAGTTPPTEAACEAVGRTCFTPQAIQSAYNLGPLYAQGLNGRGRTIAVVDSYGSDTMAHDLHVFDQAFGLAPMCGEEGVTCTANMPTFKELAINGTPETKSQPGSGTGLENKSAWALEVALDVETAHAIAPGANILLVHSNNAETLGVQGFPQLMKAEDYVVTNHLADVISQSFGSAEDAFGTFQSLENLRYAFKNAAANGVTVLASSGDGGTANGTKQPTAKGGNLIPFPTVSWPGSDPLVTGVGGTYLCTDPVATTNQPRTNYAKPGIGAKCSSTGAYNPGGVNAEVAWTFSGGGFSHMFAKQSWQNTLPAGSTAIGTMRGVPDVAFQASAGTGALVYLSLPPDGNGSNVNNTGWYDIGGTSLSSPQWGGLVAIAGQIKGGPLGPINAALYKIGANPTRYANDFFDIATNNTNQGDPSIPGYPATTGWDPVTGLGTPNAANLLPDLVRALNGN